MVGDEDAAEYETKLGRPWIKMLIWQRYEMKMLLKRYGMRVALGFWHQGNRGLTLKWCFFKSYSRACIGTYYGIYLESSISNRAEETFSLFCGSSLELVLFEYLQTAYKQNIPLCIYNQEHPYFYNKYISCI